VPCDGLVDCIRELPLADDLGEAHHHQLVNDIHWQSHAAGAFAGGLSIATNALDPDRIVLSVVAVHGPQVQALTVAPQIEGAAHVRHFSRLQTHVCLYHGDAAPEMKSRRRAF
jgi:hypothetical protein